MLSVFSFTFSSVKDIKASEVTNDEILQAPQSNVDNSIKNHIINEVLKTEQFQRYKDETKIIQIPRKNIFVNEFTDENDNTIYSVEFVFEQRLAENSNNLAYVEFKYDRSKNEVIFDQSLYSKFAEYNGETYIHIKSEILGEHYYDFYLSEDGEIYDSEFNLKTSDEFFNDVINNSSNNDQFTTYGFCEYAIAALCGTGGGAACWAAAAGLGITTGVGGFALSTVCALISSLGCQAASDSICG